MKKKNSAIYSLIPNLPLFTVWSSFCYLQFDHKLTSLYSLVTNLSLFTVWSQKFQTYLVLPQTYPSLQFDPKSSKLTWFHPKVPNLPDFTPNFLKSLKVTRHLTFLDSLSLEISPVLLSLTATRLRILILLKSCLTINHQTNPPLLLNIPIQNLRLSKTNTVSQTEA